jgi:hypothetical protein
MGIAAVFVFEPMLVVVGIPIGVLVVVGLVLTVISNLRKDRGGPSAISLMIPICTIVLYVVLTN